MSSLAKHWNTCYDATFHFVQEPEGQIPSFLLRREWGRGLDPVPPHTFLYMYTCLVDDLLHIHSIAAHDAKRFMTIEIYMAVIGAIELLIWSN